jgi:hypothetical protein
MSAFGPKQTSKFKGVTSAFDPKRTLVPKRDKAPDIFQAAGFCTYNVANSPCEKTWGGDPHEQN